ARENRLDDSLGMLRQLKAEYPANYIVSIEEANTLVKLARYDEAYAAFDALLAVPRVESEAKDYVEYAYAQSLAQAGHFDRALEHYTKVWQWKSADPDLVTLARLGAGECHDALKQRREALTEYQIVLKRPDVLDSHKRAEHYTKTAYSPS